MCVYIYTYSSCYNIYIDNYITSNEHHAVMSSNSKNILKNTPSAMPGPFHSPLHCSAPFRGPESSGSLSRTGGASMLWRIGFHPTQHQGEEKSGDHGDLKLCFFFVGHPQPLNIIRSSLGLSKLCTTSKIFENGLAFRPCTQIF